MTSKSLQDKISQGRQYRTMKLECRAMEGDTPSYIVEGYATTFNEPYPMGELPGYKFMEQVAPTAFDNCDMSDVIFQYDHEGRVFARISNKTLSVAVDEHGLKVTADLSGTEEGRKLYEEIKGGYTTRMSFGFIVRGDEEKEEMNDGVLTITRTITDISKLFDVSAVSLPANDGTEISARSYMDGAIQKRAQELESAKEAEEKRQKEEAEKAAKDKELQERQRLALEMELSLSL